MEDRTLRREARVRGSGKRNVSDSLTLKINSPKGERMLSQLKSAFVKEQDLDLPRSRRRSTLSNNSFLNVSDARIEVDRSRVEEDIQEEPVEYDYNNDDVEEEREEEEEEEEEVVVPTRRFKPATGTTSTSFFKSLPTGGLLSKLTRSQEKVTKNITPKKKANARQQDSTIVNQNNKRKRAAEVQVEAPPKPKRRVPSIRQTTPQIRIRKVHQTPPQESSDSETSGSLSPEPISRVSKVSKVSRQLRSRSRQVSPPISSPEPSSESDARDRDYSDTEASSPPAPSREPIPLSQTKRSKTQKPLTVNFQRLEDSKRRLANNKRFRVHTVDVLRHLFKVHDPEPQNSEVLDEEALHNAFKRVAMLNLDKMRDLYAVIDDLSSQLSDVQRQKNQYRQMILDLKKDHTNVGNEMNKLRVGIRKTREEFDGVNLMHSQIAALKQAGNEPSDEISCDSEVKLTLNQLSKLVNPEMGILPKLECVNDKLTKINEKL
ncbi:hypothetical protein JA1_001365 [Spathaspora sp. JA1]|nr:hypothetical protein JA1_001365 [Spathaspora sp. JA1]